MLRPLLTLFALFALLSCAPAPAVTKDAPRVLLIGDSMFAAHRLTGQAVSDRIGQKLGTRVVDRSVVGARQIWLLPITGAAGMRISSQYSPGGWDWVVMNGGGNDFLFGCGCGKCTGLLNRMISADGKTGAIPDLVARIRKDGARVVYSGYLRNPGTPTPVRACKPLGDELDRRLTLLAATDPKGIIFVTMADLVPYGDASYHALDMIHPSVKGSAAIGDRLAAAMTP